MIRIFIIIVLTVISPLQLYAADFRGFSQDTQIEYFVPRPPDRPQGLSEKILENPPKGTDAESSGTNWWLWGGLGLAVVAGGIAAIASIGSKSGGSPAAGPGGTATTTVTGSW